MARVAAQGTVPAEYLALGDSYTIGEGVEDDMRWPVQLAAALRERGVAIAHPHIIARSGWTTDELSAAIDEEEAQGQLQPPYGLVSLLIGVNDQYRGRSVDEYLPQFSRLLDRAIGFAGGDPAHVLAVSIPDWGTTPFAQASGRDRRHIAREIDEFNAAAEAYCVQRGVTWVGITDLTRVPELAHLVVNDSLHPSGEMYTLWAVRIQAAMHL
jgi:lysophospholipase L1-like esterase